jgi:serine/threonine protein kinase
MNEEIIDGKVKDSLALESLLNEIKLCLLGKHKSVIQILDFNIGGIYRTVDGQIKHVLYYVMKIAHNGELFRLIQNEMLSEKCARVVFKQIALGIRNLHNNGISHCDVKSENILFDSHLNIKIADFGYSRKFSTGDSQKIMYKAS